MKEIQKYWSQFYDMAENPQYLYVHVYVSFGWGIKSSKRYHFLYDIKAQKAQCVDEEGKEVELSSTHKKIRVDKMFKCDPYDDLVPVYTDVTTYYIFLKSGHRERTLSIDSPEKNKFKPFLWLINTIDIDNGFHPKMGIMHRLYKLICKTEK